MQRPGYSNRRAARNERNDSDHPGQELDIHDISSDFSGKFCLIRKNYTFAYNTKWYNTDGYNEEITFYLWNNSE